MKCIEGEYGSICKKGLLTSVLRQGDHRIKLSTIKKILKAYQERGGSSRFHYGEIKSLDRNSNGERCKYSVVFHPLSHSDYYTLQIGCKTYSKETVEKAIKAFL